MSEIVEDDRWVIEDEGEAVGVVIRDGDAFVFHAASPDVWPLDRRIFRSVGEARRAARDMLSEPHPESNGHRLS